MILRNPLSVIPAPKVDTKTPDTWDSEQAKRFLTVNGSDPQWGLMARAPRNMAAD